MKTKIDIAADRYFRNVAENFVPYLGNIADRKDEIVFDNLPFDADKVSLITGKKKHLLSGLYSLDIVCEFSNPGLTDRSGPVNIEYKGIMIKGNAFFVQKNNPDNPLAIALNANGELIEALSSIDLQKGVLGIDKDTVTVKLTPLGVSYMYMTFPPMQYNGFIHHADIEKLCRCLRLIRKTIESCAVIAA